MKKSSALRGLICLVLVVVLLSGNASAALAQTDWSVAANSVATDETSVTSVQNEGVVRPEDLDEGLSLKSLQDIRGRRVTVRQPVMEVTEREVERHPADVLDDTFYFIDPATGEPVNEEYAKVTFKGTVGDSKSSDPKYPMKGLKDNGDLFTDFEKYMLLRQVAYYNEHAMDLAKNNQLKKHPAADGIYGEVPENATAVVKHIVTDPIYRSPMTTGLYLVPGEAAKLHVSGLKPGQTLTLYTHHQDTLGYLGGGANGESFGSIDQYFDHWDNLLLQEAREAAAAGREPDFNKFDYHLQGQWKRQNQKVPMMGATFTITEDGDYSIGCIYGGPLYVKPTDSAIDMVIEGAVETPHFVLGVTTVEEFDTYLRKAPGLIATLDCENGQLIGYAEDMRNCDDMEKLAYFWHSVFAINSGLNGRAYNYNITMSYDMHVPAGEAVALGSDRCAQPYYWFPTCMNYAKLTTGGNWGTFHELGHVQAKTFNGVNWGMCGDGEGEVWNNTLIVLMYAMLCNMDNRFVTVEHGEFVHPFTAIERSVNVSKNKRDGTPIEDYNDYDKAPGQYFDQLSLYSTLIHSFGPDRFVDFFYTYQLDPQYCKNKRADFVYRIGLVDRVNLLPWINTYYHGNVTSDMFDDKQLEFLETLPDFYPIAYRWSNGIDGNETARKYEVDGKYETVFDLTDANFACPVGFEIVDVSRAKYGTLDYNSDTRIAKYTPPATVTESDSFDIVVRTEGGRTVTLNVRLNLLYNGVHTDVWDLHADGTRPSVDDAINSTKERQPDRSESSSSANRPNFNHGTTVEYFHTQFKFVTPEQGTYVFYLRSDDAATVTFYDEQQQTSKGSLKTTTYTANFTDSIKLKLELTAGETLFVDAHLVNWGGQGNFFLGVRMPGSEQTVDIPTSCIVNPRATTTDLAAAKAFKGWQPCFVDSIKNVTMDYNAEKDGWQVLEAPEDNGDAHKENIVDGNENNFYHVRWKDNPPALPHVFVFDLQKEQPLNYFEIFRRSNITDKIFNYKLYARGDCVYTEDMGGQSTDGWTTLFDGETDAPDGLRYRAVFEEGTYRYFKLIIVRNNGQSVIREIYAGLETKLNQTVKPSNYEKANNGFEENTANGKLSTEQSNANYSFEFLGTGFDVFADTDEGYGTARVTVDGDDAGSINLADKKLFNKCVYTSDELEVGMHTVDIVTTSSKPFNISFINVKYGTPVGENDYPALLDDDGNEDYGDRSVIREFSHEWRTVVKDYKTLTSIRFVKDVPDGYKDTYERMDTYIRLYRDGEDKTRIAFVYPGTISAPLECGSLFSGCSNLTELVFDNFDTNAMRGATSMFNGCTQLETVDVSTFDTSNTLWLGTMFANCRSLTRLDISNFDIGSGANVARMFEGCDKLQTIKVPETLGSDVSGELPGIYRDTTTGRFDHTVSVVNAGHTLELHADHVNGTYHRKVEPLCETVGKEAYYECSVCGFSVIDGEYFTDSQLEIAALGHEMEPYMDFVLPTCTTPGRDIGRICARCGYIEEGMEIPALGHVEETIPGRAPTETEEGLTDGLRCSDCGAILRAQQTIPALGSSVQPQGTGTASTQKKGLSTLALVFIALSAALVVSAVVTTIIIVVKKRK